MDNGVVIAVQCADRGLDLGFHLFVGQTESVWNHRVENHIGMGVAHNHTEIVDMDLVINTVD